MTETVFELASGQIVIVRQETEPGVLVCRVEPKDEPESYPDRDAAGDEEC